MELPSIRHELPHTTIQSLGIDVNGELMFPLSEVARADQLARIRLASANIDAFHAKNLSKEEMTQELTKCALSFEHFCDHYLWTFDPRTQASAERFILYDYQRAAAARIIACIQTGQSLLWDKSRDMGASWLIMAVFTWFFLFEKYFHAHVGSRVEDLVDDYTIDSLFGKIDFMLQNLPDWMRKAMPYNEKECRRGLKIENLIGGLISGESANQNFGRGPRKKVVYFDEFAFAEFDEQVWTNIADTAPCKIVSSTPNGNTNKFAELRFGKLIDVLTTHWTQHPKKDLAWYEQACIDRQHDEKSIAQELDINYGKSGGRVALPWLKTHSDLIIIDPFTIDPAKFKFYMSLDYGTTSPSALHVHAVAKEKEPGKLFPRLYTIWEYYQPSDPKKISEAIKGCPWHSLVEDIFADPSMFYDNQFDEKTDKMTNVAQIFMQYFQIFLSAGKKGDGFALAQIELMWSDPNEINYQIFNTCPNFIKEFKGLKYVSQSSTMSQKKNAPQKLRDKDNHCFVGSTLITMANGKKKKIKDISKYDMVLTSNGANRVLEHLPRVDKSDIYRIYLSNGTTIDTTKNHGIYTQSGELSVDRLKYGMLLLSECENKFYSMGQSIGGTGGITHLLSDIQTEGKGFMWPYGRPLMALLQKVLLFITKITIERITIFPTWKKWIGLHTLNYMRQRISKILNSEQDIMNDSIKLGLSLQNGTEVQRDLNGILKTQKNLGKNVRKQNSTASFVVERLKLTVLQLLSFVIRIAIRPAKDQSVWVLGVKYLNIKAKVFDLSVEKNHNYYANGILVSNSWDGFKYFFNMIFNAPESESAAPKKNGWDDMNDQLGKLKAMKLAALTKNTEKKRRLFKWH